MEKSKSKNGKVVEMETKKDLKDKFKVPEKYRITEPIGHPLASTAYHGNNGAFRIRVSNNLLILCIAGSGLGWDHVSVSCKDKKGRTITPTWSVMCKVKALFWEEEARVLQFHPPKSEHINNFEALHLWRYSVDFNKQPYPPGIMVGIT